MGNLVCGQSQSQGRYQGDKLKGARHGKGTFWWPSGDQYSGDWHNDEMHGQGVYRYAQTGHVYEGAFAHGVPSGSGTVRYSTGDVFEGQVVDGQPHGRGQKTFLSMNHFEGEFTNGLMSGRGIMTYQNDPDGRTRFEGMFKNDKINGPGKMLFQDQSVYNGNWVDNLMHGDGTYTYSNGDVFSGMFKQNRRVVGTLKFSDGSEYVGEFKGDLPHGKGSLKMADQTSYQGGFRQGVKNGEGTLKFPTGMTLAGIWSDGQLANNQGTLTWSDGSHFEGELGPDRLPHGHGTLFYANGNRYTGAFANGTPHGDGTMFWVKNADGQRLDAEETFVGSWVDGKMQEHTPDNLRLAALKMAEAKVHSLQEEARRAMLRIRKHSVNLVGVCLICRKNPINTVILECAHSVGCYECLQHAKFCPKPGCGKPISRVVKTYIST